MLDFNSNLIKIRQTTITAYIRPLVLTLYIYRKTGHIIIHSRPKNMYLVFNLNPKHILLLEATLRARLTNKNYFF